MPSFQEMFDGLGSLRDFTFDLGFEQYKLKPKVHPSWKTATRRLLCVIETVDRADIITGEFISGQVNPERGFYLNAMRNVIPGVLDAAWKQVQDIGGVSDKENPYSFAAINF